MRRGWPTKQAGFTVIEVMVVMAVVGILASFGIPALLDTVRSAQLRSATSQLYDAIILARSEAIKRGSVEVDVQPGTACVAPASSNTAAWTTGWGVWTLTSAGACDKQLQQFPATTNMTITTTTATTGGLSFLPTGRLTTASPNTFSFQSTKSTTIPN